MPWTRAFAGPWALALALGLGLVVGVAASGHETEPEGEPDDSDAVLTGVDCADGDAEGFPCWNVHLHAFVPLGVFGQGFANDIWGWTDPRTGREIAIIGLQRGVAFVDVTNPHHPRYLAFLPTQTVPSSWNDIKVYADHAFVVSEAPGHGMQILDLRQLDGITDPPVTLEPTAHYPLFGNAHNLAIDEETGFAYAVGTHNCNGGLHIVDVRRPEHPVFAGCFAGDGYTHDAECVVYRGPDAEHRGREICFNANVDTLTIVDVTNKDAPVMLSRTGYAGQGYTHQGWLTEDHAYFLLGDELDELFRGHRARTYVWDLSDLDAPFVAGTYTSPARSIDHNLHVRGNHVFQANYRSGFRVLRIGDLSRAELAEVAHLDTYPQADGISFSGAWGVYPFFPSGTVVLSDINRGLFILKPDLGAVPECSDGLDNDGDGLTDFPDDPSCPDADGAAEAPRSDVAIDVKPGSRLNVLHPGAWGVVGVAVLGSADFDVADVDPGTLRFGPGGARLWWGWWRPWDVNRDGEVDLMGFYRLPAAEIPRGAGSACLAWETWDGAAYEGCDAVRTVPPGRAGFPGTRILRRRAHR
jgi:choice-of-anchor B domain-containing protein